MEHIGSTIKALRIKHGLSQTEFAKLFDITETYVSLLENDRKEPSWVLMKKIAKKFSVPVWALTGDPFELPKKHTKTDVVIKKEMDVIMRKIKAHFFRNDS